MLWAVEKFDLKMSWYTRIRECSRCCGIERLEDQMHYYLIKKSRSEFHAPAKLRKFAQTGAQI